MTLLWIIIAFYAGITFGITLIALLQANGGPTPEDDAEQAAWLAARHAPYEEHA